MLGQVFIGVVLAILIVGLAAIAERRSCSPQPPAWRARRDCETHGHE